MDEDPSFRLPPVPADSKLFTIATADYDEELHDLVEWGDGYVVIMFKPR